AIEEIRPARLKQSTRSSQKNTHRRAAATDRHREVWNSIPIEIGYRDRAAACRARNRTLEFEVAVAFAQQEPAVFGGERHQQIRKTVPIKVGGGERDRKSSYGYVPDVPELAVAIAQQDRDISRPAVQRRQIGNSVPVEIARNNLYRGVSDGIRI